MKWVLIKKFVELTGYTEDAIRAKTKNGTWIYQVHFRKAPDGRVFINKEEVEKWIENGE